VQLDLPVERAQQGMEAPWLLRRGRLVQVEVIIEGVDRVVEPPQAEGHIQFLEEQGGVDLSLFEVA
jgi:hypothetical protein